MTRVSLLILNEKLKDNSNLIKFHIKNKLDKDLETILFNSLKKYDNNIEKGSIYLSTKNQTILNKEFINIIIEKDTIIMFLGGKYSYNLNPYSDMKELNCWYSVLINNKITDLDAYEIHKCFQNNSFVSLEK